MAIKPLIILISTANLSEWADFLCLKKVWVGDTVFTEGISVVFIVNIWCVEVMSVGY